MWNAEFGMRSAERGTRQPLKGNFFVRSAVTAMGFVVLLVLGFAGLTSAQTGITFSFANGEITGTDPKFYEFDVMASAAQAGTRLGDTMVYINYNTSGFGSSVVSNGKVTVTLGTLTQSDSYSLMANDNTSSKIAVTIQYMLPTQPDVATEIPTTPTQWAHLKMQIVDPAHRSGLSFDAALMADNQYESDNVTKYAPVTAAGTDDTPLPVTLSSFTAFDTVEGMQLEWTCGMEVNNLGFHIYRSQKKDSGFERITDGRIASEIDGSTLADHTYSFVDEQVSRDATHYFYFLEFVDILGQITHSHTIEAKLGPLAQFTHITAQFRRGEVALEWLIDARVPILRWHIYRRFGTEGDHEQLPDTQPAYDQSTRTYRYVDVLPRDTFYSDHSSLIHYHVGGFDALSRLCLKSDIVQVLAIPEDSALLPNFPNPFNPETWLPYQLPSGASVTICIYTAHGQLVRSLQLGQRSAGFHLSRGKAAHWDGRTQTGEPAASGVYYYTIEAGDFRATRKMILMK